MIGLQRKVFASLSQREKLVSPLARKLAAEKGIDTSRLMGSGDRGKVLLWDVKAQISPRSFKYRNDPFIHGNIKRKGRLPSGRAGTAVEKPHNITSPRILQPSVFIEEANSNPKFNTPHYHIVTEFDLSVFASIVSGSSGSSFTLDDTGIRFVLRCVAKALEETPEFGTFARGEKFYRHPGFVLNSKDLSGKYPAKTLRVEYASGRSLVNSTVFFAMDSPLKEIVMPIEGHSNFALGVGALRTGLRFSEDVGASLRISSTFAFVFDHRVIDGALAARFAEKVGQYVQNPYLLA